MFRNGKDKPSRTSRNQNNKTKAPSYAIFLDVQPRTYRHSAPLQPAPKCPPHPNFVIPEVPSAPKLRHSRSALRTQTSSFPKCPPHPNFVIPEVPSAPKLRHSRSALCPQTSSSPKYPPHPNFVILRAVAESISAHQRTPHTSQHPLHSTMDTATSRSMTALVGPRHSGPPTPSSRHSTPLQPAPKCPPHPNFVIPEVPSAPKLRHPRSALHTQTSSSPKYPLSPNFVILRAVAESISAHQRTPHTSQHPLHSTMDTATSRSMTALARPRHSGPPTPSSRHSTPLQPAPKCPPHPNFVIPEAPSVPKLRHSARSRRIHLRTPTHSPYKPAPPALHYGYCDFAQYDGVGRATAFRSSDTILPSFHAPPTSPEVPSTPKLRHSRSALCTQTSSSPKYPLHPNFVIPEVPSVPKLRHSARSRRIHLRTPTHSPYKPAAPALHYGYCDFAQYDGVGRATAFRSSDTILPSFRAPPTSPEVPSVPKLRHSARSRRIHLRTPTHYPDKPAAPALHYGYCDFAQYDGVGRATASRSSTRLIPTHPTQYDGVGKATASRPPHA